MARARYSVERATAADAGEPVPWVLGTDQGVDDRRGGRCRDQIEAVRRESMAVGGEVVGPLGPSIDGTIPAIDEDVPSLADLSDHDVQSIHVVVADLFLEVVTYRGEGCKDHVGVGGLLRGVDDAVEITTNVREASSGVAHSIRLEGSPEVVPAHRDMSDVGPERLQKLAHRVGDRLESGKRRIAADDRGSKRNVGDFESIDDACSHRSADLVADQEYESLVFGLVGVHEWIVVGQIREARVFSLNVDSGRRTPIPLPFRHVDLETPDRLASLADQDVRRRCGADAWRDRLRSRRRLEARI